MTDASKSLALYEFYSKAARLFYMNYTNET